MTCAYGKCKNGVCVDEVSDDGKEEQEDNGTVDVYGDLKPGQEEHEDKSEPKPYADDEGY
jgi:hypothetical protein